MLALNGALIFLVKSCASVSANVWTGLRRCFLWDLSVQHKALFRLAKYLAPCLCGA